MAALSALQRGRLVRACAKKSAMPKKQAIQNSPTLFAAPLA